MFETAVLGPITPDRLGVVRQCIECRRASGVDAPACQGFGWGCVVTAHSKPVDAGQKAPARRT